MSTEDALHNAIDALKHDAAQELADATEELRAQKYKAITGAAEIERFVREILPNTIEPLLPKIGPMAERPVHAVGGQPGNQFHGDHHDWRYALDVGHATSYVDSCGTRLEAYIDGQPYDFDGDLSENGALLFLVTMIERGVFRT